MPSTKNTASNKSGKNSNPENKFKKSKPGEKLTPGTAAVPSARDRAKEKDFNRRGDAESNEL